MPKKQTPTRRSPSEEELQKIRENYLKNQERYAEADAIAWGAVAEVWQKYGEEPKPRKKRKGHTPS